MYLECKAKRIFGIACLEKKVSFAYGFFEKKIKNIELKMGGTPFGRQDFSVLSLPPPLFLSPLFSSLARVSRSLAIVSRSLARLAFSRSSLALSRVLSLVSRVVSLVSRFGPLV